MTSPPTLGGTLTLVDSDSPGTTKSQPERSARQQSLRISPKLILHVWFVIGAIELVDFAFVVAGLHDGFWRSGSYSRLPTRSGSTSL